MLDGQAGQDVGTVLHYLQTRPDVHAGRLALVGSSMGAQDDEFIPYSVSERLHAAASQDSRLWLLDSGGHSEPPHDPQVQRAVADWLQEKLN